MSPSERAAALIQKGQTVLATHNRNPPGVFGFPTLDPTAFAEWRSQSLSFLKNLLGSDHPYTSNFEHNVERGFTSSAKEGIGILKAVLEDVENGSIGANDDPGEATDAIGRVSRICDRFHIVARQLRSRHGDRPTLDVTDEYDVQDLLHALLRLEFDDVRAEEYTPSYAGKSSRMDFLVKQHKVVVECKKSRNDLTVSLTIMAEGTI